jgi:selenophosphate synthetase-related protein
VQGVGVAASLDAPGEAAIMVYVLKGQPHEFVPASYDGVRTRVKETTEFKAGVSLPHRTAACVLAKPAAKSAAAAPATNAQSATR